MKKKMLATLLASLMLVSFTAFAEETEEVEAVAEETVAEEVAEVAEDAEEVVEDAEEVAEDAEEVAEDAEEVAEDAEEVAEDAEEVAEDAEEVVEDAEEVVEDAEEVAEDAEEVVEDAEEVVEEEVAEEVVEEEVVEEVEEFTGFSDVADDAAYYDAVMWAYENGVTTGYADGTFGPADSCTRGQVVTFLWRAMGEPEVTATENPFSDVSEDSAFYTAILWAVENGITTGYADGTFDPSGTCTSAHVVTFLHRAVGELEATVESELAEGAADAFVPAINWADEVGLLEGIDFVAGDASPRADIVTYLYISSVVAEGEIEA